MFELSPFETAMNASASRIPASSSTSRSKPTPTTVLALKSGGRRSKAWRRLSTTATLWPFFESSAVSWAPTRPHPMITKCIQKRVLRSVIGLEPAHRRIHSVATVTGRVLDGVKRLVVGRALASAQLEHQLLPKTLALPVFSSDPLSSVAYATEEMMLVLVAAGAAALSLMAPIAIVIGLVLAIVITSYRQTVRAYPQGGGSYIVARQNLGEIPGLIAAAAILIDYVLTVAVSVTAGTLAITSAAPSLAEHKVLMTLGFIFLIALANLRGVREAGALFAFPTYGFVVMVYVTLMAGFVDCLDGCPIAHSADVPLEAGRGVPPLLLPQAIDPRVAVLARVLQIRATEEISEARSVLAQIGDTIFGESLPFFLLQGFTAGILILAANTSYQDFPRLSAILARDRFMPSQFSNRGDRLVFSNGIVILAIFSGLLVIAFRGDTSRLIPLYAVG